MYDFVDRPVACLSEGSRFILWAMRGWVRTAMRGGCPTAALAPAFSRMDLLESLGAFHMLMFRLRHDGRHEMAFGALCQPTIADSEAVLLAFWRDVAADRRDRIGGLLPLLLHPASTEPRRLAAVRVAACLAAEGLAPSGLSHPANATTPHR